MEKRDIAASGLLLSLLFCPWRLFAGDLSPDTFSATIRPGESITLTKTVTTDLTAVSSADIFFLSDNTGSMRSFIGSVQTVAGDVLTNIRRNISDVAFGVGSYVGDPTEGVVPEQAYRLQQSMTTDSALAQAGINNWRATGGGDLPEANFFALHQVATAGAATESGVSTGHVTGWRGGAKPVVVWFGDDSSHTDTIDQDETIQALIDNNVTVIGLNTRAPNSGIDRFGQASAITLATGGTLVNSVDASDADAVAEAILDSIGTTTSAIDLALLTIGNTSGLEVSFACVSLEGCSDVAGGESREFEMTITGLRPGLYDFETFAPGVADAREFDSIRVVPIPSVLFLFVSGFIALMGFSRCERSLTAKHAG